MYTIYFASELHEVNSANELALFMKGVSDYARLTNDRYTERIDDLYTKLLTWSDEDFDNIDSLSDELTIFEKDNFHEVYFVYLFTRSDTAYDQYGNIERRITEHINIDGLETEDTCSQFHCACCGEYYWSNCVESWETEDGYTVCNNCEDNLYADDEDRHYLYEENIPRRQYVDSYHSVQSKLMPYDFECSFLVGFEAEKEDYEVKTECSINDFKEYTEYMFRKESDSSLCDESGFEFISPIMPLNTEFICNYIKSNKTLLSHINADVNKSTCGGHMTISKSMTDGRTLFESISGYIPIIFAMYYGRINNSYCRAKKKSETLNYPAREAIHIKGNAIEFRIFPAIKNINQLEFRLMLLEYILNNSTNDYSEALKKCKLEYAGLFNKVYTHPQFDRMLKRSEVYAVDYDYLLTDESELA